MLRRALKHNIKHGKNVVSVHFFIYSLSNPPFGIIGLLLQGEALPVGKHSEVVMLICGLQ